MSDSKKDSKETVETVATETVETTSTSKRLSTGKLLKSEIANERFAGFARKMAGQLREGLDKDSEEYKKITRATSKVVKGILAAGENVHEGYKEELKGAATDLYFRDEKTGQIGRVTEELQEFWKVLTETFKASSSSSTADLPEDMNDLGLF